MKKVLAILLALTLLASASPAFAYRYYFGSVDNNKDYDTAELIGNWIGAVEPEWDTEYELDIGDLVAEGTGEAMGGTVSPTIDGGIPLRSYIVDDGGQVRVFDLLISNEPEDIDPPDAPSKISTEEIGTQVEGFKALTQLFAGEDDAGNPVVIDQTELDAFKQQYSAQLVNVYTAVNYYMKAAGYADEDYGDLNSVGLAMYLVSKHFPIGDKLLDYMEDEENATRYIYLCAELYKGFYATFLRDEVAMVEFSTVIYLWSLNTESREEKGGPYALATYVPEANKWVLVDVFQIDLIGDNLNTSDIMNVMIDIRYFMSVDEDTLAIGLRYNPDTSSWQIAGMNRAAYLFLAHGENLESLSNTEFETDGVTDGE